jgi:putative membrane protein
MMSTTDLPALNAILNSTSALLLIAGFIFIRQRRINAHRFCMSAAFVTSSLFLASYLLYHYLHGSKKFVGPSAVRTLYLTILLTHTVLAVVVLPFILTTFYRARRNQFLQHRRVARIALPIWLYVSITGVIIYLMLYQLYSPV